MAVNFNDLDSQLNKLQNAHPQWHIWLVPKSVGGATWCAKPLPTLNEASPEDLETAIGETEADWKSKGVRSG
jgi:hypothetical protein